MIVQSLVTIFSGQWLWRKKNLKFPQYSFAISLIYSLQKGLDTSLRGSGNHLPNVPNVVKIVSVVIENEYYQISVLLLLSPV